MPSVPIVFVSLLCIFSSHGYGENVLNSSQSGGRASLLRDHGQLQLSKYADRVKHRRVLCPCSPSGRGAADSVLIFYLNGILRLPNKRGVALDFFKSCVRRYKLEACINADFVARNSSRSLCTYDQNTQKNLFRTADNNGTFTTRAPCDMKKTRRSNPAFLKTISTLSPSPRPRRLRRSSFPSGARRTRLSASDDRVKIRELNCICSPSGTGAAEVVQEFFENGLRELRDKQNPLSFFLFCISRFGDEACVNADKVARSRKESICNYDETTGGNLWKAADNTIFNVSQCGATRATRSDETFLETKSTPSPSPTPSPHGLISVPQDPERIQLPRSSQRVNIRRLFCHCSPSQRGAAQIVQTFFDDGLLQVLNNRERAAVMLQSCYTKYSFEACINADEVARSRKESICAYDEETGKNLRVTANDSDLLYTVSKCGETRVTSSDKVFLRNEGCIDVEHLSGYVLQHRLHLLRPVLCSQGFCATPNHAIIVDGVYTSMKILCSRGGWKCVKQTKWVNNLKLSANRRAKISGRIIATPYDIRFPKCAIWAVQIAEDVLALVVRSIASGLLLCAWLLTFSRLSFSIA